MTYSIPPLEELAVCARRVAERYVGVDIAFISGSLIEGFGNATSDLDVFLCSRTGIPASIDAAVSSDQGEFKIDIDFVGDVRTDTELWEISTIHDIADLLSVTDPLDWNAVMEIPRSRLEFAHRIRVGRPVLSGEQFALLSERFDWSRLAALLAQQFMVDYSEHSEDAVGAIQAADVGASLLNSRRTLGAAVDAYCAAAGQTNSKEKWRLHRLRQVDAPLCEKYLKAELDATADPQGILEAAKQRVRFAGELASRASVRLGQREWAQS